VPPYESAQVRLQCAEKQMEVIGHQHVCVDFHMEQSATLRELVEKGLIISCVVEDTSSLVAAIHDVTPHAWFFYANRSRHKNSMPNRVLKVNSKGLTPI